MNIGDKVSFRSRGTLKGGVLKEISDGKKWGLRVAVGPYAEVESKDGVIRRLRLSELQPAALSPFQNGRARAEEYIRQRLGT